MTAELGARIRAARIAKGRSLRALAAEAEISPSLLSQVETGKVQPSVSTLWAIVTCLGLSVDDVLGHEAAADAPKRSAHVEPVQLAAAAPEIVMENGVTWRGLAVIDSSVDSLLVTYGPGASSSIDDTHMRHSGTEYGYLIRGELTLRLDFETYVLRAGDSFCFDSMRPHLYQNRTDAVAEGVWFVVGRSSTGDDERVAASGTMRSAVDVLDAMSRLPGRTES
ncbi:cupin domain-containing protein [Microbacterium ulmi]|uniref:Cupin domain-containing protein n=1 Tax=Microbacterium ulmi TaxID=179095 RepID=A0A7Y2LZ16_9MICO|nr:cupin domain-containing protein [Microbacterium ulmi]NII68489.1 transcriptional regulator with XRE-family HTH domain [Microbacterium ulmi]NNH02989.1 cupin domain-containing protein [Microbacterium ulmi]